MSATITDQGPGRLHVDIDGFEGPLDLLLTLARNQKVDLAQISILELVEQYIAYIRSAHDLKLEIAADYLVMAAWLAYLKSRLLIPADDIEEELSAEELALRLQLRLQRLDAMRESSSRLMGRDRLGRDFLLRGMAEGIATDKHHTYDVTLYELLKAYGEQHVRNEATPIRIERRPVLSLDDALERLTSVIGGINNWQRLVTFLPDDLADLALRRSAVASFFAASLELARQGRIDIDQTETYGPLMIRQRTEPHQS